MANINTSEHIRQSEGYLSGFSWCSEGSVSSLGFLHPHLIFLQSPSSKLTTRVVYLNLLWCLLFNLQSLACLKNSHFYAKHGACRTNLYFFNKINGIDITKSSKKEVELRGKQKPVTMCSVCIWSSSGPYFPAFRPNTERCGISLRIQSACGKIRTTKTPNADTFQAVSLLFME